jgi:hypothetical protein
MSSENPRREDRLKLVEDHIARSIAHSQSNGELKAAKGFGKPLDFGEGYQETPEELRIAYKILKDAGYLPPEVELMREIEALKQSLAETSRPEDVTEKMTRLSDLRQKLAILMESLGERP